MLLEVRVISASNLARADVGPCPDIFVVLGFGNTSPIQRTNVCYNAVAPSWGEVFRFAVRDQGKEYLNVILKSKNADEEIAGAKNALDILNGQILERIAYNLPVEEACDRELLVIKKTKSCAIKYPRRSGLPRKNPL